MVGDDKMNNKTGLQTPSCEGTSEDFTLRATDALERIAKDNNLTVSELLNLNGNGELANRYLQDENGTGLDYILTVDNQEVYVTPADVDGEIALFNSMKYLAYYPEADNPSIILGTDGKPVINDPVAIYSSEIELNGEAGANNFLQTAGNKLFDWLDEVGQTVDGFFDAVVTNVSQTVLFKGLKNEYC